MTENTTTAINTLIVETAAAGTSNEVRSQILERTAEAAEVSEFESLQSDKDIWIGFGGNESNQETNVDGTIS